VFSELSLGLTHKRRTGDRGEKVEAGPTPVGIGMAAIAGRFWKTEGGASFALHNTGSVEGAGLFQ
jgi:hypothetical protein